MTPKEIKEFNSNLKNFWNQGIFTEPIGVPDDLKEPVMYLRYETGGISGGTCWEDSNPQLYTVLDRKENWEALDKYLELKCPEIGYFQYKNIINKVISTEDTSYEYYGNCTDYAINYIKLSELDELIEEFNQ